MNNPIRESKSLPDHMSDSGDRLFCAIEITVDALKSVQIRGPLEEREYCLQCLEKAKAATIARRFGVSPDYREPEYPAKLIIKHYCSSALAIEGPINLVPWTIRVLEHAQDAVRAHRYNNGKPLIIPSSDVSLSK